MCGIQNNLEHTSWPVVLMNTRAFPEDGISADSDPALPGVGRSYSVVWTAMSKVALSLPAVTMHVCSVNIAGMVTSTGLKSSEELNDGRLFQDLGFPDITLMLAFPWQGAIYIVVARQKQRWRYGDNIELGRGQQEIIFAQTGHFSRGICPCLSYPLPSAVRWR